MVEISLQSISMFESVFMNVAVCVSTVTDAALHNDADSGSERDVCWRLNRASFLMTLQ